MGNREIPIKRQIQGVRVPIPGIDVKALRGKHASAYQRIYKKEFGSAARDLAGLSDETVAKMMAVIEKETAKVIARIAKLDQDGQWHTLKKELPIFRRMFGGVPLFDKDANRWNGILSHKSGALLVAADKHLSEGNIGKAAVFECGYGPFVRLLGRFSDPKFSAWVDRFNRESRKAER